jgi:hypothetical protein
MSGERWLADMIEMHRRLTFVDKNSKDLKKKKKKIVDAIILSKLQTKVQKKKNSGRHSLQVADLHKYKPTLSFISPQKFSLSPKCYSLPP